MSILVLRAMSSERSDAVGRKVPKSKQERQERQERQETPTDWGPRGIFSCGSCLALSSVTVERNRSHPKGEHRAPIEHQRRGVTVPPALASLFEP